MEKKIYNKLYENNLSDYDDEVEKIPFRRLTFLKKIHTYV
jgi:hypothetical protein